MYLLGISLITKFEKPLSWKNASKSLRAAREVSGISTGKSGRHTIGARTVELLPSSFFKISVFWFFMSVSNSIVFFWNAGKFWKSKFQTRFLKLDLRVILAISEIYGDEDWPKLSETRLLVEGVWCKFRLSICECVLVDVDSKKKVC